MKMSEEKEGKKKKVKPLVVEPGGEVEGTEIRVKMRKEKKKTD